jgi:predicted esterase
MKKQAAGIFLLILLFFCIGGCMPNQNVPTPMEPTEPPEPAVPPTEKPTEAPSPVSPTATSTIIPEDVPPSMEANIGLVFAKDTVREKLIDRKLDLYTPTNTDNWPILLFLPGRGESTSSYIDLAQAITERSVMVFVVDYPMTSPAHAILYRGKGYREIAETVACAIRFARAAALESGNEAPFLAISGFSLGGGVAAHNALAGESVNQIWEGLAASSGEPTSQVECTVGEGSTHVDALIGISGAYDAFVGYDGMYGRDFMQERDPDLWELFFSTVSENPDLKVRLLHSETDSTIPYENSVEFRNLLSEEGYDVQLIPFNSGHSVPNDLTIETIMSVFEELYDG